MQRDYHLKLRYLLCSQIINRNVISFMLIEQVILEESETIAIAESTKSRKSKPAANIKGMFPDTSYRKKKGKKSSRKPEDSPRWSDRSSALSDRGSDLVSDRGLDVDNRSVSSLRSNNSEPSDRVVDSQEYASSITSSDRFFSLPTSPTSEESSFMDALATPEHRLAADRVHMLEEDSPDSRSLDSRTLDGKSLDSRSLDSKSLETKSQNGATSKEVGHCLFLTQIICGKPGKNPLSSCYAGLPADLENLQNLKFGLRTLKT